MGLTAPYASWCPTPFITDDRQRQAGPGKSRKPVHDCTCLEAVISTLTKFTGRPPASFLPSPMCGKNVNLGAPTGIPHHRVGSSNRREQTTRGNAVFIRLGISETPNAPWGCLRVPAGRQVQPSSLRVRAGVLRMRSLGPGTPRSPGGGEKGRLLPRLHTRRRRPFEVRRDQGKDGGVFGAGDPETLRLLGIARPRVLPMKTTQWSLWSLDLTPSVLKSLSSSRTERKQASFRGPGKW